MPRKISTKSKSSARRSTGSGTRKTIETQIQQIADGGDDLSRARTRRAEELRTTRPSSGIPSQEEYEQQSLAEARRRLDEVRRAPLADRKEAQVTFLEAMRDQPELVAERVDWILDGNYGYGEMMMARRVLASPRMNRAAALTHMAGALEWNCPEDLARLAWRQLSKNEQAALDQAVQTVIHRAETAAEE